MKKRILSLALCLALILISLVTPALAAGCPVCVDYNLGPNGVSADLTSEEVASDAKPKNVPEVEPLTGYQFLGWSLTDPAKLKAGEQAELVDPLTVRVQVDTTFYAVYAAVETFHGHYVIGYPNGTFGPTDNINRASVATIIARAILPDFVEGSDYGNPGGYSDVNGHWAESAIAYCSKYGVFKGYTDGTFRPNQPITRQEFTVVMARLDGVLPMQTVPFSDITTAGGWALDGIYTAYVKGWVNGYEDGTFKPLNNIQRAEAVKIFNAYLGRGVNEAGLADLEEYVHSGTASNTSGGEDRRYMTWPDVQKGYWAYYEIIEAANDHQFYYVDPDAENADDARMEHWSKCWIDGQWNYHDDAQDGGPAA